MASPPQTGVRENGWLPDLVFTGGRFERDLAFFADPLGRISRFSREPADLAQARRLTGQAVLPGLVDSCARSMRRLARGRADGQSPAVVSLSPREVRDVARMVFVEMLLSGVTCVAEFHADAPGASRGAAEVIDASSEILRAAREIGIRLALGTVAGAEQGADGFVRVMEAMRATLAAEYPGDEAWLAAGLDRPESLASDQLKTVAAYAHTQRLRLAVPLASSAADTEACVAKTGRRPLQWLAENGILDKRLIAVHAGSLTADEMRALGTARASLCLCPADTQQAGVPMAEVDAALAAGATVALGSGEQGQGNLLGAARQVPDHFRGGSSADRAARLFHALTVGGARSLGAPSGALEVGRPADFFTVNLYDPSIAGARPEGLLEAVVFALERRAVRDVWIGGRQRLAGGRHAQQGPVVARFVEIAQRASG